MGTSPLFPATGFDPKVLDQVDDDRTGGGTYDTVVTAGASGARVDGLNIRAVTATQNCKLLIFHRNGTDELYIDEVQVHQVSPTDQTAPWGTIWYWPGGPRILDATDTIVMSITSGSGMSFHVAGLGGNY
jgi:hypothetical protein